MNCCWAVHSCKHSTCFCYVRAPIWLLFMLSSIGATVSQKKSSLLCCYVCSRRFNRALRFINDSRKMVPRCKVSLFPFVDATGIKTEFKHQQTVIFIFFKFKTTWYSLVRFRPYLLTKQIWNLSTCCMSYDADLGNILSGRKLCAASVQATAVSFREVDKRGDCPRNHPLPTHGRTQWHLVVLFNTVCLWSSLE